MVGSYVQHSTRTTSGSWVFDYMLGQVGEYLDGKYTGTRCVYNQGGQLETYEYYDEKGELLFSGLGVARGYLNLPEQTNKSFIKSRTIY